MVDNKLICVVGMAGAGKSVVSDEFIKKNYQFLRFGQITLDTLKEKGHEINEKNERMIREGLRREHGMGAYAILNIPKFDQMLEKGNVVGDGLYSWSEYKILKDKYGENLKIITVYAPPKIRYERLEKRKLEKEDTQLRNRPANPEVSKLRDYSEIENIEKGGPIAMADYVIINDGSLEELYFKIDEIISNL